jgi:hypothetical protein
VFTQGYALLIGVSQLSFAPSLGWPGVTADLEVLTNTLCDPVYCDYPREHILVLSGAAATRSNLLDALHSLAATPDAVVLLYFSGYAGYSLDGEFHLATFDTRIEEGILDNATGLSARELVRQITALPAERILVTFNIGCAAGMTLPVCPQPPDELVAALLAGDGERAVLSACREDQRSLPGTETGSLFGAALAAALRDGRSAPEFYNAVFQRVHEAAPSLHRTAQEPVLTTLVGARPFTVLPSQADSGAKLGVSSAQLQIVSRQLNARYCQAMLHRLSQDGNENSPLHTINTGGGDYAEGSIDKRQYISIGTLHIDRSRPSSRIPFQTPSLPGHFVPRPEITESLKKQLLSTSNGTAGVVTVSAVHGLGGIGKSTIVAALTYDHELQARFPDGVLWATLGQQPDVLALLSGWVQALGDYEFHATVPEVFTTHLRGLLRNQRMLLVIDDAWKTEDAELFRVGGEACRVLITTREAEIAKSLGAILYSLDIMSAEQSLALIERRMRRALSTEEWEQAAAFAKEVEYLPLALELAAVLVADGASWAELRRDQRSAMKQLEALALRQTGQTRSEALRKKHSVIASFQLSLERLTEEQKRSFAWLGILPEDVVITQVMATTLWDIDEPGARQRLLDLYDRALLMPGVPAADGLPTYRLHDLVHEMAGALLTGGAPHTSIKGRSGLGISLPKAHAALLDRYRSRTQGDRWHTLKDDGYIYANLTWHMEQAGVYDKLHALMREETETGRNGWHWACERAGYAAGFLADTARAWRLSAEYGLQCRYALIVASLNSLAQNLPPTLLAALVNRDVWTPAQALVYVRQVPEVAQRAEALAALAPYVPATLHPTLLDLAEAIGDDDTRTQALTALAPLVAGAADRALAAARAIPDTVRRTDALLALLPTLSEGRRGVVCAEVAQAASEITSKPRRAELLVALAQHLTGTAAETTLVEARNVAAELGNRQQQITILSTLIRRAHERGAWALMLEVIRDLDEDARFDILTAVLPSLSDALVPQMLAFAQAMGDAVRRVRAIVSVAAYLPIERRQQILTQLQRLVNVLGPQPDEIAKLPPHIPLPVDTSGQNKLTSEQEKQRASRLQQLARFWSPVEAALALAPALEGDARRELLVRAAVIAETLQLVEMPDERKINNRLERALAYELGMAGETVRAVAIANRMADTVQRLATLAALVESPTAFPEDDVERSLDELFVRGDGQALVAAETIAPYLRSGPYLQQVAERVNAFDDRSGSQIRHRVLIRLAERLSELREYRQALDVVRMLDDEGQQASALIRLTPLLDSGELSTALRIVEQIRNGQQRTKVIIALAPRLDKSYLEQALAMVQRIEDTDVQQATLETLRLLAEQQPVFASKSRLRKWMSRIFIRIREVFFWKPIDIPTVAQVKLNTEIRFEERPGRVNTPATLGDEESSATEVEFVDTGTLTIMERASIPLRPLPKKTFALTLELTRDLASERNWALTLAAQAANLSEQLVYEALELQERLGREGWALARIAPRLAELGDVQRALEIAKGITDGYWHPRALNAVIAVLPPAMLPQALVFPTALPAVAARLSSLGYPQSSADGTKLRLPPEIISSAFENALTIPDADSRLTVLDVIGDNLVQLPPDELQTLWDHALHTSTRRSRRDVMTDLRALARMLPVLGNKEDLIMATKAILDVGRWWQ